MATLKVYTLAKFEDSGSHRSREICDRTVVGRERKWTNEGDRKFDWRERKMDK